MKKLISPLFCAALFFAACNDETTTVSATSDAEKVTSFKDLDECDSTIVGKLVYVKDSVKAFICTDDGWAAMSGAAVENGKNGSDGSDGKDGNDGKDGKNGADGKNGKDGKDGSDGKDGKDGEDGASCTVAAIKGGYKVLCGGDSVGVLLNGAKGDSGAQGLQGIQGIQGEAGESCTAKENKADDGYDIECGGKKIGFIKNGTDGASGKSCTVSENKEIDGYDVICDNVKVGVLKNGAAGKSAYELSGTDKELDDWLASLKGDKGDGCTLTDNGNGTVTVTCGNNVAPVTLYKAMCGTTPYDPEKGLCKDETIYSRCGNEYYNTETQFCFENKPFDKCSDSDYDPTVKICVENKLYDKCGSVEYNPQEKLCDTRDNKLYKIVTIAPEGTDYSETWMSENLNYETAEGSYCAGDNETDQATFCNTYGRLYTWAAAVGKPESECGDGHECTTLGTGDVQGVCPEGWHLPSYREWEALLDAVGSYAADYGAYKNAGKALKSKTGWSGGTSDDTYSFAALPAGSYNNEVFVSEGNYAYFWSSTQAGENNSFSIYLCYYNSYAFLSYFYKYNANSVRCIKD